MNATVSKSIGFAVLANNRLTVINIVDVERYVMGVCACEMTEVWPIEALKAQAVAARTFVQKNARRRRILCQQKYIWET